MEKRHGYGFSQEAKQIVHERAGNSCEWPNEPPCELPNNKTVNHLESAFVAFLDHKDKRAITDPNQNALMLCQKHDDFLEAQQRFQAEQLLYERFKSGGVTLYDRTHNRSARTHRRRR